MIVQWLLDSVNVWRIISGNLIHHCGFRWEMGIMSQVLNKVYPLICYTLRSVCLWFHLEYISPILRCVIGIPMWQLTGFQTHVAKAIVIRMERWKFYECPDIQILKSRSNTPSLISKGHGDIGVTHKYLKDVRGSDSCHMAIYLECFPCTETRSSCRMIMVFIIIISRWLNCISQTKHFGPNLCTHCVTWYVDIHLETSTALYQLIKKKKADFYLG